MRRTAGVTHITVFTRPDVCGGSCLYCPRVPDVPHSYLPHSNIARFGLSYSSREQMAYWIAQHEKRGPGQIKIEVLILGGSFAAHPVEYQQEFLRGIYQAVEHSDEGSLENLVEIHSGSASHRIIGITIEARPNQINEAGIARLFAAGVTKIEMGVQSLDDEVLAFVDRGHFSDATARATRIVKRFGLKVGYHLLLGLPGASRDSDLASTFRTFDDPAFQPDHLKIYFCEMFRREFMRERFVALYDSGEWRPLPPDARMELMQVILPRVPVYMRVSRIGRKVSGEEMENSSMKMNRADVEKQFGCRCIRCREPLVNRPTDETRVETYVQAISENEVYIEARPEGKETCLGLLRLHTEGGRGTVRELHVYGRESAPGTVGHHQHRGIGKMLMRKAEEMSDEIAVSSGVGVRQYYERLNYSRGADSFMKKEKKGDTHKSVCPLLVGSGIE